MVFSLPDRLCLRSEITLMHIVAADVVSSVAGHTPTYYSDKEYLSKSSYSLCKFSRSIFSLFGYSPFLSEEGRSVLCRILRDIALRMIVLIMISKKAFGLRQWGGCISFCD